MDHTSGEFTKSDLPSQGQLTIEELRGIISGKYITISRAEAIALLNVSDAPDKQKDFESILENQEEHWTIRYLAAAYLGNINTPESRDILIRNTSIIDEQVLASVMKSLGRIGDKKSLDAILNVERHSTGFAAVQAEFAATLISYRLNLEGKDLPDPLSLNYLTVPNDFDQIEISLAKYSEIRKALKSISKDPFGIQLAEKPAYEVSFGPSKGIILFNQDLMSHDFNVFLERKLFFGIFAEMVPEHESFSVAYLILTSPSQQPNIVNIFMTRPDGSLVFGGTAKIEDNTIIFTIRSISQVGVFPVLIKGTIKDNKLEITDSRFSSIIQK